MRKPAVGLAALGLAALGCLAAATVIDATPTEAGYEGPWCARVNIGGGTTQELCNFATFEDCRQEVYRSGPTTFCSQNPRFLPYWQAGGEPRRRVYARPHKRRYQPD